MATPTSGAVSNSSSSTSGWGRSGDSGNPFNDTSRTTHGGRGRGGHRGGRGGRSHQSTRELKSNELNRPTKPHPAHPSPPKSSAEPTNLMPTAVVEKAGAAVSSAKPKPPSRKASRVVPSALNTQASLSEQSSAPNSAKTSNRRRRSQASKPIIPSKIMPPASDDNFSSKLLLGSIPKTAPIKDAPPHLNNRFDMRHDIDALVERVRAVAMDNNRPSTPGSHIDWAGDDDDSLPDLDDWVVKPTTTLPNTQLDVISPIIVDGLKPLPDVAHSMTSSPLRQFVSLEEHHRVDEGSAMNGVPSPAVIGVSMIPDVGLNESRPPVLDVNGPLGSPNAAPKTSTATLKHLHPSLPNKPMVAKVALVATPTRSHPGDKPDGGKNVSSSGTSLHNIPTLEVLSTPENEKPLHTGEDSDTDGLAASMHAPKSRTAPANMPSFAHLPTGPRDHQLTHTRAHTAGRPPSFPHSAHAGNSRFPRHVGGRGGLQPGYHSRTHSSPPVGSPQHRAPASRPVITGDAMSRLVRTIGKSSVSPKPQSIPALGD